MHAEVENHADNTTLFAALLAAARTHGFGKPVIEDTEGSPLTYKRLVLASFVLGARFARETTHGETVGVLLPNANGLVATLLGLNAVGRTAAILNFTAGTKNLTSAVRTALVTLVISSRRFIAEGKLEEVVGALEATETAPGRRVRVIYLEDIRRSIGTAEKTLGAIRAFLPDLAHRQYAQSPDAPAVVLFTSGTEGAPKGVMLSSRNLVANSRQIFAHATGVLTPADIMFNPLPMFHSFGLTAGTVMPLLNGLRVVLHPSPLQYRQIPKRIAETKATVLLATDTFLQGYARAAAPGDLASVRFVVAGAERVRAETRALWKKSGTEILEGYGATECSPVLAVNLPKTNRPGTVGALLPEIEYELQPVEGIRDGGLLAVRGPNVMLGYMLADCPGTIVPPHGGWHDTGDIASVGMDRFVTIRGRAKRFAKIGGEMISLAAVESMVAELWPEARHVVVAIPDPRKGEQLVLVTEKVEIDRDALQRGAKAKGYPELWVPRTIVTVPAVPLLGSGKTDMPAAIELARQKQALVQ